jgi:hypothetical protein
MFPTKRSVGTGSIVLQVFPSKYSHSVELTDHSEVFVKTDVVLVVVSEELERLDELEGFEELERFEEFEEFESFVSDN